VFAAALAMPLIGAAPAQTADKGWVAAWGTSQQRLADEKLSNASVRTIARLTLPGDGVRLHFQNIGAAPVRFGKVTVGPRVQGPRLAQGLVMPVTFAGGDSITLSPGASAESDPVALHVEAQQDIAVSVFVSGADVQPNAHGNAYVTNYVTDNGAGDQTGSEDGKPFTTKITSTYWLSSIDVHSLSPARAIVAFGDSLTDGTCTTVDGHERWEDILAQRLALQNPVRFSVVNEGVGGDTALGRGDKTPPPNGWHGIDRLARDVLSQPGIGYMILFAGSNDAAARGAPAEAIIDGLKAIIGEAKAKGIKVVGVTIVPRQAVIPGAKESGWTDEKTKVRNAVNAWIRKGEGMAGVLDFDKIVRDPADPDRLDPAYNCGDGIHPSLIGYFRLGKSVDLKLFK
jgi:lysophospholipase L1-like esterase